MPERVPHPLAETLTLERVLAALADPVRIKIVRQAANGEYRCQEFCSEMPKATRSHHFKVLREAGLIQTRVEGTSYFTTLRRADLDRRFPGLLGAVLSAADAETTSC